MVRELTLSVDESLYNILMPMVEKQTIGNLLAEFVQTRLSGPAYTQAELEAGYKAMAADDEYEQEAMEWCNGLMARTSETVRMHLDL